MPRTIGEIIRHARTKAGFRQAVVARAAGIAPAHLCMIESGVRVPTEDVIGALASCLGLDPARLMAAAGRMDRDTSKYLRREPLARELVRRIAARNLARADLEVLLSCVDELG